MRAATEGQAVQCIYCGNEGLLRVGPNSDGAQRVEVWLQCAQAR
ncbi:MAG: hypothetical protein ACE5JD_07305 [Candidatus Methylomirabilia bacterium]